MMPPFATCPIIRTGGTGPLAREQDSVALRLFSVLAILSLVATVTIFLTTDAGYQSMVVLAVPFFVLGLLDYIVSRRWVAVAFISVASVAVYVLEPVLVPFILYVLVCAEGVVVMVEVIQRLLFFRIVRSVEGMNIRFEHTLFDRAVRFLFSIPCDLDTRNLVLDPDVRRDRMPWGEMLRTMMLALCLCMFLWMYMFLNPSFSVPTSGALIYTFTIVLYVSMAVMPWGVFGSLDVRIATGYRDFRLFDGLFETMKRMFLPAGIALLFLVLALSSDGYTFYYVSLSIMMIVITTVFSSVMYYTRNEPSVVGDILTEWAEQHPVDIYSGYGMGGEGTGRDVPGTPRRDPDSCFQEPGDQKY